MRRTTGVAGILALTLQLTGQALMQSSGGEPAFDAPADEILAFFRATDPTLFAIGSFVTTLSLLATVWFVGGLVAVRRDDWRSPIALACGILYAAGAGVGWELAVFRIADGIGPDLARLAFDLGNLSFATAWVALGGFAVALGWGLAAGGSRALGWWGAAAGIVLIAARAVWTTPLWVLGAAAFWAWAITLSVHLLRGRAGWLRHGQAGFTANVASGISPQRS